MSLAHRCPWMLVICVLACAPDEELVDGVFTPAEWDKIATLSPLPDPPKDTTNKYADDPDAAALGHRLFFEAGYSGPLLVDEPASAGALGRPGDTGRVSCASCHEGPWMIDLRSQPNNASLGADWIPRNANSIVNAVYYLPWIENDGISDSIWSDALVDPEFPLALNGTRTRIAHVIWDKHRAEYEKVFGPLDPALDPKAPDAARFPIDARPSAPWQAEWDGMTAADQEYVTQIFVNFGKAIDAYLRLFISKDAPFDRYVAGDFDAISVPAKRGLKLFVGKAGCVECHDGPHFSDNEFHVNGLRPEGPHINPAETGRLAFIDRLLTLPWNSESKYSDDPAEGARRLAEIKDLDEAGRAALTGVWRTKALRQAAETGPYMHTGQFKTLREVVVFYNEGGHPDGVVGVKSPLIVPLNLSDSEIDDIVAFLETLTGEQVPTELTVAPK